MTEPATAAMPVLARVLIAGAGIMSLANSVTVPFLAVFLHRDLGLNPGMIGFIVGSSVFFSIFAGFVGGSLSDALGRTLLLRISLLGVIGSFLGLYFSDGVPTVLLFNATLALSSSCFAPVAKALLSDLLPRERRAKTFSYQYVATNIGYAVGPVAGAAIGLAGGRPAFLAGAAGYGIYLTGLAVVQRIARPGQPVPERAGDSETPAAERACDCGRLMSGRASDSGRPVSGRARGSGRPVAQRSGDSGQPFVRVVQGLAESARIVAIDRRLLFLIVAGLLLEAVHGRISSLLAQHLSAGFADGVTILGYVLATNAVTVVVLQVFASRFAVRRDPITSITVGGVLTVVGMAGFAVSDQIWHFVAAMVVFSLGEILIYPAEFAIIDRIAPEANRGAYFGAQTFAQLGVFIGPLTGGLLLEAYGGTTMFLGVGLFALAGVIIYLLVGRRIRAEG